MYTTQIGTESECSFEMQSIIIIYFILCMCDVAVRATSYGQLQLSTALFTRRSEHIFAVSSLVWALAYWRQSRNTWSKSWDDFYVFLNEYRIHTRPSMQLLSIVQCPIDSFMCWKYLFISTNKDAAVTETTIKYERPSYTHSFWMTSHLWISFHRSKKKIHRKKAKLTTDTYMRRCVFACQQIYRGHKPCKRIADTHASCTVNF